MHTRFFNSQHLNQTMKTLNFPNSQVFISLDWRALYPDSLHEPRGYISFVKNISFLCSNVELRFLIFPLIYCVSVQFVKCVTLQSFHCISLICVNYDILLKHEIVFHKDRKYVQRSHDFNFLIPLFPNSNIRII